MLIGLFARSRRSVNGRLRAAFLVHDAGFLLALLEVMTIGSAGIALVRQYPGGLRWDAVPVQDALMLAL